MGERGPMPKPTKLRMLDGETRPDRVSKTEVQPREVAPKPYPGMSPAARRIFTTLLTETTAMHTAKAADEVMLSVLAEAVAHHRTAEKALNEYGLLMRYVDPDGMVDYRRCNAWATWRESALVIRSFARDFGLSPGARVGLNQPVLDPKDTGGSERLFG